MKPFIKAILFLIILIVVDLLFRKGLVGHFIPFNFPLNANILVLFTLFALFAWLLTKWFCKSDKTNLNSLGISLNKKNRTDFTIGLIVGIAIWGIISIVQSFTADFTWVVRPNVSITNVFYGLVFIFIADLGSELYTRGYALTRFKDRFGVLGAIIIMSVFTGLISFSFGAEGKILVYTMLIPTLHTVFFSLIYFKTKRLGGALGVHTGGNFITISIFDFRV